MEVTKFTGRANINLYRGDCNVAMAGMRAGQFDLGCVDPPYGIGVTKMNMGGRKTIKPDGNKKWDNGAPAKEYFDRLKKVSENQIIWGGNYFKDLPIFNTKLKRKADFLKVDGIIWDKGETMYGRDFSECEIAYSTTGNGIFKLSPNQLDRIHPTQKPVALYKWLLANYAKQGDTILDTHGGSMSLAIACWDLGFDLDLYELDADYYTAGVARVKRHVNQMQFEI